VTTAAPSTSTARAEMHAELARLVREVWCVDPARIVRVSPRVCRVQSGAVDMAVKVFPARERASAVAEAALLAHLSRSVDPLVHVQRLVAARSGAVLIDDGDRVALATHWREGTKRAWTQIDASTWERLGATLAALHDELQGAPPEGAREATHAATREAAHAATQEAAHAATQEAAHAATPGARLAPDVLLPDVVAAARARDLAAEARTIEAHRERVGARTRAFDDSFALRLRLLAAHGPGAASLPVVIDAAEGRLPVVHNDYNENNYLFVDDGGLVILDWDRAARAPPEFDVVRCLNHLPLVAPTHAQAFVRGYRTRRALRADVVSWAVDVALTAHAVKHWPVERFLAGEADAPALLEGFAPMLRAFAEGGERLRATLIMECTA
jgi:hypothetical protein